MYSNKMSSLWFEVMLPQKTLQFLLQRKNPTAAHAFILHLPYITPEEQFQLQLCWPRLQLSSISHNIMIRATRRCVIEEHPFCTSSVCGLWRPYRIFSRFFIFLIYIYSAWKTVLEFIELQRCSLYLCTYTLRAALNRKKQELREIFSTN